MKYFYIAAQPLSSCNIVKSVLIDVDTIKIAQLYSQRTVPLPRPSQTISIEHCAKYCLDSRPGQVATVDVIRNFVLYQNILADIVQPSL